VHALGYCGGEQLRFSSRFNSSRRSSPIRREVRLGHRSSQNALEQRLLLWSSAWSICDVRWQTNREREEPSWPNSCVLQQFGPSYGCESQLGFMVRAWRERGVTTYGGEARQSLKVRFAIRATSWQALAHSVLQCALWKNSLQLTWPGLTAGANEFGRDGAILKSASASAIVGLPIEAGRFRSRIVAPGHLARRRRSLRHPFANAKPDLSGIRWT
jgi:hypothetical protein